MRKKILIAAAAFAVWLPLIHPFGPVRHENDAGSNVSTEIKDPRVREVLERVCGNCHSERTKWPVYSYLPLVFWALERDVAEGRRHVDFSQWEQYSPDRKRDLLARIGSQVRKGRMPPARYVLLHPDARLSESEIQTIYEWTKVERSALRSKRE
jgi:cytochrome c